VLFSVEDLNNSGSYKHLSSTNTNASDMRETRLTRTILISFVS
jgi:hypothetical protein